MAYFTNKYTSWFLSTYTHLVFPRQPSCLFRELIYACKHDFKCMVKLDIVSVEILTNIMFSSSICIPKIHMHTFVRVVSESRSRSMFLKIVKIHMKTSETESLFHKVAGLQPSFIKKDSDSSVFLWIFINL